MTEPDQALARLLRRGRKMRGLSLRSVEEATGISNAYLSQLEHGRFRQPSPIVLHKLCALYKISYTNAMRLAGYPIPKSNMEEDALSARSLSRFTDFSADEEH